MTRPHAIVLFSGGLDSLLAVKVLMEQGIEVTGFHVILPFIPSDTDVETLEPSRYARDLGIRMIYHSAEAEYLQMLKNPAHGYGKHINPCIDCKIYCIRKGADCMRETGADFVATGEVVGQRPMSQLKHMLRHIEKESGIEGRLLRPLCAKLMKPTIPEQQGLVDRDRLLDFNGRGRGRQMDLAKKYGITDYASPAGGCLFTDTFIAPRVRDLLEHQPDVTSDDIFLQTVGRHFRLSDSFRIVVSRNQSENLILEKFKNTADKFFIPDFRGPHILGWGNPSTYEIEMTGRIMARYGKKEDVRTMQVTGRNGSAEKCEVLTPVEDKDLVQYRI